MRFAEHLRGEHLVDLETVSAPNVRRLGEPSDILGIAPEQEPRRPAVPHPPMHLVFAWILQQIGVTVPAVMLIPAIHMRRMKRHTHLFHPILRSNADRKPLLQTVTNNRVGQLLCPQVDSHPGMLVLDHGEHFVPEPGHLISLQTGLAMHPELEPVQFGEPIEEPANREFVVRGKIVRVDAIDQAGDTLADTVRRTGDPAALHTAAIDMVPNSGRNIDAPGMRNFDHPCECRRVARLFFGRNSN